MNDFACSNVRYKNNFMGVRGAKVLKIYHALIKEIWNAPTWFASCLYHMGRCAYTHVYKCSLSHLLSI